MIDWSHIGHDYGVMGCPLFDYLDSNGFWCDTCKVRFANKYLMFWHWVKWSGYQLWRKILAFFLGWLLIEKNKSKNGLDRWRV